MTIRHDALDPIVQSNDIRSWRLVHLKIPPPPIVGDISVSDLREGAPRVRLHTPTAQNFLNFMHFFFFLKFR